MSDLHTPGPPPCKVLYSEASGWAEDAPEHLKLRPLRDIPDAEPAPRVQWVYARNAQPPRQQAESRAKYAEAKPAKVAKRMGRPPLPPELRKSPRRGNGRGMGWNRIQEMTIEVIHAAQAEGLSAAKIAARFGCDIDTVFKRLRLWRSSSADAAKIEDAARTCACGRRKLAIRARCGQCSVSAEEIQRLQRDGLTYTQIAERLGCGRATVVRRMREQRGRRSGEEMR